MLKRDASDTEVVKDWLTAALVAGAHLGKSAKELATHCHTTPQAVSGWKKTGRITKTNLEKATEYFGHGPSFTRTGVIAMEPLANGWPFPGIDRQRLLRLAHDQQIEIQGLVRERMERFEADSAGRQK